MVCGHLGLELEAAHPGLQSTLVLELDIARVSSHLKPSCSCLFTMAIQQSYQACIGHIRDVVGLSPGGCCAHAATEFIAKLFAHLGLSIIG